MVSSVFDDRQNNRSMHLLFHVIKLSELWQKKTWGATSILDLADKDGRFRISNEKTKPAPPGSRSSQGSQLRLNVSLSCSVDFVAYSLELIRAEIIISNQDPPLIVLARVLPVSCM